MGNALVRPRNGKMIGGVCAALAHRFGVSAGLVRALFVISIVLPGPQVLLYLGLWIFIPGE
jgi:phage shock protein PspC (stress-responsive transcriptional regulator)